MYPICDCLSVRAHFCRKCQSAKWTPFNRISTFGFPSFCRKMILWQNYFMTKLFCDKMTICFRWTGPQIPISRPWCREFPAESNSWKLFGTFSPIPVLEVLLHQVDRLGQHRHHQHCNQHIRHYVRSCDETIPEALPKIWRPTGSTLLGGG